MPKLYCLGCTWGDITPATHDIVGLGPKCCYDAECGRSNCEER